MREYASDPNVSRQRRAANIPPASPRTKGKQGCPACGHVASNRMMMLEHYKTVHNAVMYK